jgi:hypothetical protein
MSCKCVRCGAETGVLRLGGLCNPCHYEDPDLDPIEDWTPPKDLPVPAFPEEDDHCVDCEAECPTDNQCHFCGETLCDNCAVGVVPVCMSCDEEEE